MKKISLLGTMLATSMILVGCGGGGGSAPQAEQTLNRTTDNFDTNNGQSANVPDPSNANLDTIGAKGNYLFDKQTGLSWVASKSYTDNKGTITAANSGSYTAEEGESIAHNTYDSFCKNMIFAGASDWRLPTISEYQTYRANLEKDSAKPYYLNGYMNVVIAADNSAAIKKAYPITTYLAKKYKNYPTAGQQISWSKAVELFGTKSIDGQRRTEFAVTCVMSGKPN